MLTCSNCGNKRDWRKATQTPDGTQSAVCAVCGHIESRTGGVVMDTVTGGMSMTTRKRKEATS